MSLSTSWFLAWRYITGVRKNSRINTVSFVCFLSIFISSLCLTLQVFVSEGFDHALTTKMQSIYPQLVLEAPDEQSFDMPFIKKTIENNFKDSIAFFSPAHTKRVVIKPIGSQTPSAVVLKAIDPLTESSVSSLATKLQPALSLEKALTKNMIIIGKKLADFYDLQIGERCTLLFTPDDQISTDHGSFESTEVIISGIMETGIVQYDKYTIICSLEFIQKELQEDAITLVGCKLQPKAYEAIVSEKLEKQFQVEVHSWKTLYPALVSVSKLEKYVMMLLLMLMALLAVTNIISLLFMQITQKKTDIALLKTMGMSHFHIVALFMFMGIILVGSASFTGICSAIFIGFLLQTYPFITLPDAYFCTHLPVHIDPLTTLLIFCIILFLGIVASWFSARSIHSINITQTLRFDS